MSIPAASTLSPTQCPTCCQPVEGALLQEVTNYQEKNTAILKDKVEVAYHSLFLPFFDQPNGYLQLRVTDKQTGKAVLKRPLFLMHVTVVRLVGKEVGMMEVAPLADSPDGADYLASGLSGWEMMRFFFLSRMQAEVGGLQRLASRCEGRGYGDPFDAWWFKFDKNPMRRASPTTLLMKVAPECPFFDTDLKEKPVASLEQGQKAILAYEYFDGEAVIQLMRAVHPARFIEIQEQLRKYKYGDSSLEMK